MIVAILYLLLYIVLLIIAGIFLNSNHNILFWITLIVGVIFFIVTLSL